MFNEGGINDPLSQGFELEMEKLYKSLDKSLSSPEEFKKTIKDHFQFSIQTPPVFHHLYKTVTDPVALRKETAIGTMVSLGEGVGMTVHGLILHLTSIHTRILVVLLYSILHCSLHSCAYCPSQQ